MSHWFDLLETRTTSPDLTPDPDRPFLIAMKTHRLLQASGPDAVKFLQGQLTSDLRRLEQQDHLLGAHCNAKGRMISSFVLAAAGEGHLGLRLRADLADTALAALRKYIVFSKAKIETSPLVPLTVLGQLHSIPLTKLPPPGKSLETENRILLRHTEDHLEIWVPETDAPALWYQLAPVCTPADLSALESIWVERGLAEVCRATSEEFVPQMLNYHLLDGVSFKKGCYTGQEIIARMQYRGQSKKHTYRVGCEHPLDLEVGATLVSAADTEKTLATLVASAPSSNNWRGLVVCNYETPEKEAFLVAKKSGAKLAWLPLPYAIPNQ